MKSMTYYAYAIPSTGIQGITDRWEECKKIVSGISGATYKGFKTRGQAQDWLDRGAQYKIVSKSQQSKFGNMAKNLIKKPLSKGIYFDAGTGRGHGVEISVTDGKGHNLLGMILAQKDINRYGKHVLGYEVTNNYGELLACKYAIELALHEHILDVFGDSKLVISYWSKGHIKNNVAPATIDLACRVANLRREFERKGGKIKRISGAHNPADLGFHK